jgi:ATP adenylyltransferase
MSTPETPDTLPKFVDLRNVRTPEQREWYQRIQQAGIDPFERDHFVAQHPHPMLHENETWLLTHNAVPYPNTELHLLLVHKPFITDACHMTPQGWTDLGEVMRFAQKEFCFESNAFMMRSGDTSQTGGSVTHLHAHIIVAKKDGLRHAIYPVITPGEE